MNQHWFVQLGDVADFVNGFAFKPQDWHAEGLPIIRIQNLTNPNADFNLSSREVPTKYRVEAGDLLVSWSATLGVFAWSGPTALVNQHIFKVVPDTRKIDLDYLRQALDASIHEMERFTHGSTMKHINRAEFLAHRIPLPPLDEQRQIAAILDKADALRSKRKRAIALLDSLTQSIFLEMFGDPAHNHLGLPIGRIGDLLESATYGSSGKAGPDGAYPMLRMGNLTNAGQMDYSDLKRIDLDDREIDRYTVRKGDILFNRTNSADLVGKTAVFDRDEAFAYAGYLVRARTKSGCSPEYVSGYLNSPHGKKTLRGMAKSIVGMANINAKEMQSIPILVPDGAKQREYATLVHRVRTKGQSLQSGLATLDTLFTSLQHRAFSGQL